ncbi:AsmA-like C-terminal region-containing protein [Necropsobacter massiliensis]|uniref:AsmA-like C-terminal region-containing protein n=1 Tax=Necropsobacter massiliensis TaxID=1400001 RepID=UPI0005961C6E|nr:AsmA-like C-terminal region-containing protein [Necropsobacter massiliensis]
MWKKIALSFMVVVIAILSVMYVQKDRLERQLTASLHKHDIQFEKLDFQFFLSPKLTLEGVDLTLEQGRRFTFAQIDIALNPLYSLIGDVRFSSIALHQGQISKPDLHDVNIVIKPTALCLEDLPNVMNFLATEQIEPSALWSADKWRYAVQFSAKDSFNNHVELQTEVFFSGLETEFSQLKLTLNLHDPLYSDKKQFDFSLDQAIFSSHTDGHHILILKDLSSNNETFRYINIDLNNQADALTGYLVNAEMANIRFQLDSHPHAEPRLTHLAITGKGVAVNKWFNLLKLPAVISGKGDVQADIFFDRWQMTSGQATFALTDGEFNGLNILNIIAQHLPINYDAEALQNANSQFERLQSDLRWDKEIMLIDHLRLKNRNIRLFGRGMVALNDMRCDISLNIGLTDEKYKDFTLPLRFFDSCYSPQYKIEMTRDIRHQIKELLRQKLER